MKATIDQLTMNVLTLEFAMYLSVNGVQKKIEITSEDASDLLFNVSQGDYSIEMDDAEGHKFICYIFN